MTQEKQQNDAIEALKTLEFLYQSHIEETLDEMPIDEDDTLVLMQECREAIRTELEDKVKLQEDFNFWKAKAVELAERATLSKTEWLPIESAPRDGTVVLLSVRIVKNRRGNLNKHKTIMAWHDVTHWKTLNGNSKSDNDFTHWMPLPTPPTGESQKG